MIAPIFIAGAGRSGTTLLRWLLDSHPNVVCRSEQYYLRDLVKCFNDQFIAKDRLGEFDAGKFAQLQRDCAFVEAPVDVARRFRILHESFYHSLCRATNKRRWADGTHVINDYFLPAVDTLYEHVARHIVIVRHGLDVAVSVSEKFGYKPADSLRYWHDVTARHLAFVSKHEERCLLIKYEDLVVRPQEVSDYIFHFVREPPIQEVEKAIFASSHGPAFGDHKIHLRSKVHQESIGRWKGSVGEQVRQAAESNRALLDFLAALGYEAP